MSGKILLTGGAGFIAERLASALANDRYIVHMVDNLARGKKDDRIETLSTRANVKFYEIDLVQRSALDNLGNDYDFVIHLAAVMGVQTVAARPYQTLHDNVLMQEGVIRFAARQTNLKRILFTSTSEVYAGSLIHLGLPLPTPENTPLALPDLSEPRTSYMLSKIYGEAMLLHSGLPYTIVRPHNVYGPRMGMTHVIPQLLMKVHNAEPGGTVEVFSVDHKRCFCYIDDAIEMLLRVLKTDAACHQVLNLGAEGPEVTIQALAEVVIDTVGKNVRIIPQPPTRGSPPRRLPDMTQMRKITSYSARTPLQEGVRSTYRWYKTHEFPR